MNVLTTKNLTKEIKDYFSQEYLSYEPVENELKIVQEVFNKFLTTADIRNQTFAYLDGRTIIQQIDDNVEAFTTNIYETEFQEDWQSKLHDPFTRNKTIAVLSKVVGAMPVIEYYGRGDEDLRKGQILTNIVDYVDQLDDYDELMLYALLEALVKGTFVGYEGYEEKESLRRSVTEKFGEPLSVKESKEITRRFYGSIVKLEEFYPCSVGIRKMKDMPYCFWKQILTFDQFKLRWGYLDRAKYVLPKFDIDTERKPFYYDYLTNDVKVGEVEIIRYYNQEKDQYVMLANGIWLNSMEGWEIEPLPWEHKKLPFWSFIYEPYGSDFFYGKSFADKMSGLQNTMDVLHNMLLDQSFLSIFSPILIAGGIDVIEDDFLRPGRRIPIDTGGLPINQMFSKLEVGTPVGWHQFILDWTKKVMEETSTDANSQGMLSGGERVTATEVRRAASAITQIIGLFSKFVTIGLTQKARLRASNILQFIDKPFIEKVLGEGSTEDFNKAFNTFKFEDTVLSSGKRGLKIIDVYREKSQLPGKQQLKIEKTFLEKETGKKVEKLAIIPEYLRNWEFDIRLVANTKLEGTKEMDRAFEIEFQTVMNKLYPDLVDREELAAELIERFDKKPETILKKEVLTPAQKNIPPPADIAGEAGVSRNMVQGQMAPTQ